MKPFSHLHTHSHYSLLNALPKIPDLVETAKADGMKALALTDNGNLYGAIEFYKECESEGIKPIIGVDAFVALRSRFDKQAGVDNLRYRLILLAKNEVGYKNLIELVTRANIDGFYYKPRIDKELIEKHSEGIIAISPSFSGEISSALKGSDEAKALESASWYKSIFGDDFYIEITHHPEINGHAERMKKLEDVGKKLSIPLVAAHDVYYLNPEDKKARDTLMSVQTGGERERGFNDGSEDFSFISQAKANEYFKDLPQALDNIEEIINKCNLKLTFGSWVFPDLKVESGLSYEEELRKIVYEGIESRGLERTDELVERIEYELKIIQDKGFAPYFLVVGDLLQYAHEHGILTNIRGSVAGSIVTYLVRITKINPIEYKLPFERFLNPERPSAPDIDMDFADNRRDEMIAYARAKYGAEKVAQIGTFGTMMARGAVRDVARALGHPYSVGDRISKLIPMGSQGFPMTLVHAFELVPELSEAYDKEDDVKEIIDLAKKIEGCARHISVHAAGVVIAPTKLTDYTPLQLDTKEEGKIISQYDMYSVEEAGLLKFDFLGIRNLAIIADALDRIKTIDGLTIDIEKIPVNDKKTFQMLARGETEGTFQLNGSGMTRSLMELKPTNIHDINVMVALYRPGPMDNINDYIARKHGKAPITFLHPKMETFLDTTFGVLVYQDDLLMTAIEVAGYSWGEVDKFRKAVGKKIPEEMKKQHIKFVEGCVSHGGMTTQKAEEIWKLFEPFQGYGFNKAHAASYGLMAYETAYLKANFPAIYMSAVLTAESGDVETIGVMVAECKRMGIPVLPPSINESYQGFSVVRKAGEPDTIRFGLTTIKNFGEGIGKVIVTERKKNGKFVSLADFLSRVKDRGLNKKSLEALIKTGALDEFGERGQMLENLEMLLEYHKEQAKDNAQDSLFGLMSEDSKIPDLSLCPAPPATMTNTLQWEKELLGLFISGHPLDKHREKLEKKELNIAKILEKSKQGTPVTMAGIIEEVRDVMTKNNERMLFLKIADLTGSIDAVVFPRTLQTQEDIYKLDTCIVFVGKISKRNSETSIIIEKAKELD